MDNNLFPETQDLFERIPDSRNTSLVVLVAIIMLALLAAGYFVKSPDIVSAEVRISGETPPQTMKAKTSGELILLQDCIPAQCMAGDYIACINNPANARDVKSLKHAISSFNIKAEIPSFFEFESKSLGELSQAYGVFLKKLDYYQDVHCPDNEYEHNIKMLQIQIAKDSSSLNNYYLLLEKEKGLLSIIEHIFLTDSLLFSENAILESQLNLSKMELLEKQKDIITERKAIETCQQDILECRQNLINVQNNYRHALSMSEIELIGSVNELKSEIRLWENQYVFCSDVDGVVEYANLLGNYSFVSAGEPVFNVHAANNEYYGVALMASIGAGTVCKGQLVNIKIEAYPFEEYGMLKGVVKDISLNYTSEGGYLVYIDIPSGMVSTNGVAFTFAEAMIGKAEIITKEKRLINKIFNRVSRILSNE